MNGLCNLEPLCAEYGMRLVQNDSTSFEDRENVVNKALGVLVENGLYAMSVFLLSCQKKQAPFALHVLKELLALCADSRVGLLSQTSPKAVPDQLEAMRSITNDLPKLILARKLLEAALTFGRYHCKALKREEKNKPGGQA